MHRLSRRVVLSILTALALSLGAAAVVSAHGLSFRHAHGAAARQQAFWTRLRARAHQRGFRQAHASAIGHGDSDLADEQAQYGFERTAPALSVSGQALIAANQQAGGLSTTGGPWQDVTTQPYNAEPAGYTDPFWSNVGAGFSLVGGRITALVQALRTAPGIAGAADGGVWRSTDQGADLASDLRLPCPDLSIGALAVDPADGSLWVGTGEANTSPGLLRRHRRLPRQPDGTATSAWSAAANNPDHLAHDLPRSPSTRRQRVRRHRTTACSATRRGRGTVDRGARPGRTQPTASPYRTTVTDVAVVPGTGGQDVIAAIGWRGAAPRHRLQRLLRVDQRRPDVQRGHAVTGDIDATDIGRTTFAYSADGSKLYAIVQSPPRLAAGDESVLQGIFVASGRAQARRAWPARGPRSATRPSSPRSGSAWPSARATASASRPGTTRTSPSTRPTPDHVYVGLEEVFESTNARHEPG